MEQDAGPPPPGPSGSATEGMDLPGSHSAAPAPPLEESSAEEPEYDPDEDYGTSGQADLPEFPITHELILKDHTKVVSALALDPSGARILSGSHDYDCKLWDFGGMDQRCKPFKSWEPAESYHVSTGDIYALSLTPKLNGLDSRFKVLSRWSAFPGHLRDHTSQTL